MIKISMGGNKDRLLKAQSFYRKKRVNYTVTREGGTSVLNDGTRARRFFTGEKRDMKILGACKAVKKQCTEFEAKNGKLPSGKYNNNYYDIPAISKYIGNGGRRIALLDVDHCYWQIAFKYNLINQATYDKYVTEREARLISIGCTKRSKKIYIYRNGRLKERRKKENPLSWVWDFVNYKSFEAMEGIRQSFGVFSFHTDGAYMEIKDAKKAQKILKKQYNLDAKIIHYTIIGYEGLLTILRDDERKNGKIQYRRTVFRLPKEVLAELPKLDFKKLPKK